MAIRVTYDPDCDAAHISLREIEPGGATRTLDTDGTTTVMLDFDREDRLIGIEVMGASRRLPPSVIDGADLPDGEPLRGGGH